MVKTSYHDFISLAEKHHGTKFVYDECGYTTLNKRITLTCNIHGEFTQFAADHANGHGCTKCYTDSQIQWYAADDEYLKQNYRILSAKQCADTLNKTMSAIYSRATTLGITRKIPPPKNDLIPNFIMGQIRRHAKSKNRECSINESHLLEKYISQNKKCALSGWDIYFAPQGKPASASVDRIDSSKGYIPDNIQLLHADVNLSKRVYSDEYFVKICKAVARNINTCTSCES